MSEPGAADAPAAQDELDELRDELRRKARPGERLVDTHRRLADDAAERRRRGFLLERVVEGLPVNIFAKDREHRYVFANRNVRALVGHDRAEVLGKTDFDLLPEASARTIRASDERLWASGGQLTEELSLARPDGESAHLLVGKTVVRYEDEELLLGFAIDITERRRVEEELRRKLDLIAQQRAEIETLSTPIVEVWDRVLTTPMLGVLDRARAGALLERLLAAVSRRGARFAIVDLTGVATMDAETAAHLLTLVEAVRLLGAEAVLTGMSPAVARAMVALGVDLEPITTLATLRDGLRHCIRALRGAPK